MTREEKQKAIDALKISATVMAVTQEEFNNYIQILNKVMDWLEQEPVLDKIDEIITDALDKSTDQKESQTLRWVLDKISEVTFEPQKGEET